jgi:phage terminase small subunit
MGGARPEGEEEVALTPKQARFVEEYLVDLNATQAAIRAGYSAATAYSIGHECLKKPEIAAALRDARRERARRLELTADDVLLELWLIAVTADRTRTRLAALSWIGKHLGMFTDNVRVSEELPTIRFILDDGQDQAKPPA